MRPIIEKIYEAEHPSCENIADNENYKKSLTEFCRFAENFKAGLTEKQKEIFKKLEELHDDLEYETGVSRYVAGFKFGLKVGMEITED